MRSAVGWPTLIQAGPKLVQHNVILALFVQVLSTPHLIKPHRKGLTAHQHLVPQAQRRTLKRFCITFPSQKDSLERMPWRLAEITLRSPTKLSRSSSQLAQQRPGCVRRPHGSSRCRAGSSGKVHGVWQRCQIARATTARESAESKKAPEGAFMFSATGFRPCCARSACGRSR